MTEFLQESLDDAMQDVVAVGANDVAKVAAAQQEVRTLAMIVGPDLKEALYAEIEGFEKARKEQDID